MEQASLFGATGGVDVRDEDAVAGLVRAAPREGFDWSIVTVGAVEAMRLGVDLLRPGGTAVMVGLAPENAPVRGRHARARDLREVDPRLGIRHDLTRSCSSRESLDLYLGGRLRLDELVSTRLPIERIDEAFELSRRAEGLRPVLTLSDGGAFPGNGLMRITGVRFHKINVPFEAPMLWSGGVNRSWTRIVVRMQTDEGIEGIAETCGGDATLLQLHAAKEFFLGEDPFDRERILKNFWYLPTYQGNTGKYAIQALETACLDIMGKATGRPLCQLLGGRMRTEIPMIAYMFFRGRGAGRAGRRADSRGAPRGDARDRRANRRPYDQGQGRRPRPRERVPGDGLDPRGVSGSSPPLRPELPLVGRDVDSLRTTFRGARPRVLRGSLLGHRGYEPGRDGRSTCPLATNMCTLDLDEIPQTIRLGAIDVMLLDPCDWGGVTAFMKAAATFQVFQIGIGMHSGGEAGISTALQLQLAAALPVLPYAIDSHYHHQTDDVITKPHEYVDGCFRLPEGPGLGVEIDDERLARLEALNEREGDLSFIGHEDRAEPRYMGMW